ncbi:MAG: spore germination protein [Clostridia bacterium]|nr:spore germination protein [Clostridia bacterium]
MPGNLIFDLIGFRQPKTGAQEAHDDGQPPTAPTTSLFDISPAYDMPVSPDYQSNLDYCVQLKGKNADLLIREFTLADGRRSFLLLVDGMCSKQSAEQNLILPAMQLKLNASPDSIPPLKQLSSLILNTELSEQPSLSKGFIAALTGDLFLCIEGLNVGFVIGARSIQSRSVSPSETAGSVVGPHEGFTENLRTNTALIRRRISDPNFTIETLQVGLRSHTAVALCYINGVTNPSLVNTLRDSIQSVTVDLINDAGELAQMIEQYPLSPLPQIDGTEKPDAAAAEICQGRAAVIVNGSPYVLLTPATMSSMMQVTEDRYQRWTYSSFLKILRWIAFLISITAPSLYVAIVAYNPGLLPVDLLLLTAANRINVPFSAVTEVVIMEFFIELLREASIRLPGRISSAMSIVGGLIVGDAAIRAGLVSPLLIIIIGLTSLTSFVIPSYELASSLRLVKYFLLALSAVFGIFGLTVGLVLFVSQLCALYSYGTEFTAPFSPAYRKGWIESLIELPVFRRDTRPAYYEPIDLIRMK